MSVILEVWVKVLGVLIICWLIVVRCFIFVFSLVLILIVLVVICFMFDVIVVVFLVFEKEKKNIFYGEGKEYMFKNCSIKIYL